MSSIVRSQSLRNPATSSSGLNSKTDSGPETRRNVSPSKLPVKGMLGGSTTASLTSGARTRATSTAAKSSNVASTTATTRSRPISGPFGLGRSASVRQPSSTSSSNAATSSAVVSRPPITSRSRPTPRPTSASGPSPLPSRPTSSSGVPSTSSRPAGTGHARAKSTATALTGATTLRPPAQPSSTKPTPSADTPERPTRSAALPPRLTHTRTSSTSSTSTSTSTTTAPRKRPVAPSEEPSHPSSTKTQTRLPPKPAFSTLQQHYSPAKHLAPKPLTSTYLAPPSPSKLPSNIALSAETARLQTELLQLHLLRRDADTVCAAWRESARRQLGERFHALVARGKEIRALEAAVVERGNAAALIYWGGDELEEKTRLLDVVLSTVWAWNDTGGKYARVVRRFERWAEEMEGIVEARGGGLRPGEEVVFVSDLDASWKGDCEPLGRKLEEWRDVLRRDLKLEGGRVVESSLERIVGGLEALVDDMIAELALMVEIEREAIRQEDEWVKSMNRSDDGGGNDTRAGAIWRVL